MSPSRLGVSNAALFAPPAFQGRPGADGARGMPGEPGGKVPDVTAARMSGRRLTASGARCDVVTLLSCRVTEALTDSPGCPEKRATGWVALGPVFGFKCSDHSDSFIVAFQGELGPIGPTGAAGEDGQRVSCTYKKQELQPHQVGLSS